ncbi:transposase [Paludibacterium paludis]|uniref:transposase n=1 Tax=Paludibacterium paludis TaxID=1225769 RepID=UPI003570E30C
MRLSPGQSHESRYFELLLEAIRIGRRSGTVRQRPQRVAGDKGYSHRRIGQWRRKRGIPAVIPERKDREPTVGADRPSSNGNSVGGAT